MGVVWKMQNGLVGDRVRWQNTEHLQKIGVWTFIVYSSWEQNVSERGQTNGIWEKFSLGLYGDWISELDGGVGQKAERRVVRCYGGASPGEGKGRWL